MLDNVFTGRNGACQRNHPDFFMTGQRIAYRFATAKQHVDNASRINIFGKISQLKRRQRGNF